MKLDFRTVGLCALGIAAIFSAGVALGGSQSIARTSELRLRIVPNVAYRVLAARDVTVAKAGKQVPMKMLMLAELKSFNSRGIVCGEPFMETLAPDAVLRETEIGPHTTFTYVSNWDGPRQIGVYKFEQNPQLKELGERVATSLAPPSGKPQIWPF